MKMGKDGFLEKLLAMIPEVVHGASEEIDASAMLFAKCIQENGVIHAFGTGHSQSGALELAGRAGGLIPTNKIDLFDLVFKGGHPMSDLIDPLNERKAEYGRELFELSEIGRNDVVVILSNSGINGAIVQFALDVKMAGVPLIAIGSRAHAGIQSSRHDSGKTLTEIADIYLDNGAPAGDSILETKSAVKACGVSSITTAFIVQSIVAETVKVLEDSGQSIPVYVSANIEGGHERNLKFENQYAGRIKRLGV
jgi:uncharacterized phosphosugar-binding protein